MKSGFSERMVRLGAMVCAGLVGVACAVGLSGCNRASAGTTSVASAKSINEAQPELEIIPLPTKSQYLGIHTLALWNNPYLTVQENMVTLHVTMADANTSSLGVGGMLRPVGARRQVLNIRMSDLPDALSAVPEDSWPYGRVVAVLEAEKTPASEEPAVRRNVETTLKLLNQLGVVAYEWNDSK